MDLFHLVLLALSGMIGLFGMFVGLFVLVAERNSYPEPDHPDLFACFLVGASFFTSWALLATTLWVGH